MGYISSVAKMTMANTIMLGSLALGGKVIKCTWPTNSVSLDSIYHMTLLLFYIICNILILEKMLKYQAYIFKLLIYLADLGW